MEVNSYEVVSFHKTPLARIHSVLHSEEAKKYLDSIKEIFEQHSNKEHNLDIDRVRRFVENEVGISVNCSVYVINQGEQDDLQDEFEKMSETYALDTGVHGAFDPSTNSVIVFDDKSPKVHLESIVVHEMLHSIGYKSQVVEYRDNSLLYKSKRSGLSITGEKDYGDSFEEGVAEHYAVKYRQKFADAVFFTKISKYVGHAVHGYEDFKGTVTRSYRHSDVKLDLPTGYLSVDSDSIYSNRSQIFAYAFDLMNDEVYKKTAQNLEVLSINAKRNPSKIKDLAHAIDSTFGKGTYLKFQNISYSGDSIEELIKFIDTIKGLKD